MNKAQLLVSGVFLPQFRLWRTTVTCKAMAAFVSNVPAKQGDCYWLFMSYNNQRDQDMPPLSTISASCTLCSHVLTIIQPQLDSEADISFFFLNGHYLLHWQLLVSVKGILWGECLGWKSASLTPASSTWLFVLVCIARVCVSREYTSACICLWTVLFIFLPWFDPL